MILGEIAEFLKREEMSCAITQEGITDLVCKLFHYKEEDKLLRPEVYIVDNLSSLKMLSGDVCQVYLGGGPKTPEIMSEALKKGAPLCEKHWAIYIYRKNDGFEYGVFKKETSPVSSSAFDLVQKETGSGIILIHQITGTSILVKGSMSDALVVHFGSDSEVPDVLYEKRDTFLGTVVRGTKPLLKENVRHFLIGTLNEVEINGHGTLACVVDHKSVYPKALTDGVILQTPIDISSTIESSVSIPGNRLESYQTLVSGMLKSDGITVFSDEGAVLAYRVFVKDQTGKEKKIVGGARTRAFEQLKKLIESGAVISAYMQTQEGKIDVYWK